MQPNKFKVKVAYASPTHQRVISLDVAEDDSLAKIIADSGITKAFPEIDLDRLKLGVFGKRKALTDTANPGDRIEIYRELVIDPKSARRKKARRANKP